MDAPSFSKGCVPVAGVLVRSCGIPAAANLLFPAFTTTAIAIRYCPLGGTSKSPEKKVAYSVFPIMGRLKNVMFQKVLLER